MNFYSIAADGILMVHLLYILFTVGGFVVIVIGGILHWQWVRSRRFRLLHLVAVLFVAAEALLGVLCPLTRWEYQLRRQGGALEGPEMSLVARIIQRIIFYDLSDQFFLGVYVGFGLIVVLTFVLVPISTKTSENPREDTDSTAFQ